MKSFKLYVILLAMFSAAGLYAQNYEVKGVVIDAKGNPVVGATVRTNKSKASATTGEGGVYTLTATPKDTELRLIINKYTAMEKPVSAEIARMPVAFEMDETNDPSVTGYTVGDTYYPGSVDMNMEEMLKKLYPSYVYSNGLLIKFTVTGSFSAGNPINCYDVDGTVNDMMTVSSPQQIYSIKHITNTTSYGEKGKNGVLVIVTKAHHEMSGDNEKASISMRGDSIRGVVKDGWGRVVPGMKIRTSSGEETVSDENGNYAIKITKKDKFIRCMIDYTEGTTVRISKANTSKPVNLIVMLNKNDLRGWFSDDLTTYFPGAADGNWADIVARFPGAQYIDGNVYFSRQKKVSIGSDATDDEGNVVVVASDNTEGALSKKCALIVLDGVAMDGSTLDQIEPHSVYSVQMVKDNAIPLYGTAAQFGAVVVNTKGVNNYTPVASADLTAVTAKQRGDMKGFIAAQGKNLEYEDGFIKVNGEICQLYIINGNEYSNMRGIDTEMIDEIMILNDDMTASYGEKAKHGVVLISASQKEKRVIDDEGNTVTEEEYKKAKRKK